MQNKEILISMLSRCNAHYLCLYELMTQLLECIESDSPLVIRENLLELDSLQSLATRIDKEFLAELKTGTMDSLPAAELTRRKDLLDKITALNSLLVDKLEGKMSVMASEIDNNRRNQQALGGYRIPRTTRGGTFCQST